MIDTIRFRVKLTNYRRQIFESISCKILTLTPDGKELRRYNKFIAYEEINSQFQHIYISTFGNFLYFEFSLHKMINRHKLGINYNHNNYNMVTDYSYFTRFVNLLNRFEFDIKIKEVEITRADVGVNYFLKGLEVLDFFEILYLQLSKFSKIRSNHFQTSVYYPSRWVTKKLYAKHYDLKSIISKGNMEKTPEIVELLNYTKNIIRLEFSLKKQKLKQMGVKYWDYKSLKKIREYYREESMEILKFKDFFNLKNNNVQLTLQEKYLLTLIGEIGYKMAREDFIRNYSRATFYRLQKQLQGKGFNIKSITKGNKLTEYSIAKLPPIELKVV